MFLSLKRIKFAAVQDLISIIMLKRIFNLSHIFVAILTLLIVWICSLIAMNISFFNPIKRAMQDFSLSDVYYQVMQESGDVKESKLITIVDMTTLYDRGRIAQVIEEVNQCNPCVVGIDVMFEGLKGDTIGSEKLVEAICQTETPIVAFKLKEANLETGEFITARHSFFAPLDGLQEGYTNVQHVDLGGIIRHMSTWHLLNTDTVYSLSYHLASTFSPDILKEKTLQRQLIDYTPTYFPVVPYDSILEKRQLIENRIVLLGAMNDDADMHYSPFGRTAGTCIQAYTTQTLLEHQNTKELSLFWNIIISFLIIVITDIFQCELTHRGKKSHQITVRFLLESTFIKNVINFIWMAFLLWINFLIFAKLNVYFNPTIMLMGIVIQVEGRLFYLSGIATYRENRQMNQSQS